MAPPKIRSLINTARLARIMTEGLKNPSLIKAEPLLNVGWGPKIILPVFHASNSPLKEFILYNPYQYQSTQGLVDFSEENTQNPFGVWFATQTQPGVPSFRKPKYAKARELFQTRPYEIQGLLTLDKPIVTIGDVTNRNLLEWQAERAGADGIIFQDIYDNGMDHTVSIKSQKQPDNLEVVEIGPGKEVSSYTKEPLKIEYDKNGAVRFKKGGLIHIKKKNEGKFTESAKAAGESVQEHARKVLNDPNATPLQKKRANFARNAAKWKHQDGAKIQYPIRFQNGGATKYKRVNWQGLQKSPAYRKNYGWYLDPKAMKQVEDSLIGRGAGYPQRLAALSQVVAESGGRTQKFPNGATGLVGWRGTRAKDLPKDLAGQIHVFMDGLFGPFTAANWNDGGKGTNVGTGKEMQQLYVTSPNTVQATKAVMKGYVRPETTEYDKRVNFVNFMKQFTQ